MLVRLTPILGRWGGGADDNLIIHGDNLHALKALLPRYSGQVKCIYIDPPYNTGHEDWVYNDKVNSPLMAAWLKENSPIDDEDLERHDKWLCMMWPRLHLLKELLTNDGMIFLSIDDNEQPHLRMMMDEIFGAENFVGNFIWNSTKSITNPALVSISHTYILSYARNLAIVKENRSEFKLPPIVSGFHNPDNDPRGPWKADPFEAGGERPNQMYPIENPNTGKVFYPNPGNCWKNDFKKFKVLTKDNRIVFGKSGKGRPQRKRFLSEASQKGLTPNTWWDDVGTTTSGTKVVKNILGNNVFKNPKPLGLLDRILQLASDKNSIVLDSFAGSGTTGHAVLAKNKKDGGNRKFILVECEDYADRITAERIRRVILGNSDVRDAVPREGLGGSFTYCTLGDPLDAETMLAGEVLPAWPSLAAWLLHTASGISAGPADLLPQNKDGLFFSSATTDYYLLYKPDRDWLRGHGAMFNEKRAKHIAATNKRNARLAVVFAPGKYMSQRDLTTMRITFCQLPYEIHRVE